MQVELVSTETSDGVGLDGVLRRPEGNGTSRLGVDLVICHHGVGGKFYGRSFFDAVGGELLAQGCAVLRVNNRGHDSVYNRPATRGASYAQSQRARLERGPLGAACEIVDESRHDWKAWNDFAAEAGYRRICLWGHSLGAVKTIYYLARENDARVVCAIASSPPRFSSELYEKSENADLFKRYLDEARRLVAEGRPHGFIDVTFPTIGVFTASTYLDKYAPGARYDILAHLPNIRIPMLLSLGELEAGVNFRDLAARGPELEDEMSNMTFRLIAGADHAYTGKSDDLWREAHGWLQSLGKVAAPL